MIQHIVHCCSRVVISAIVVKLGSSYPSITVLQVASSITTHALKAVNVIVDSFAFIFWRAFTLTTYSSQYAVELSACTLIKLRR